MISLSQHLDALLLAIASSTDNFTVGLSVGIGGNKTCLPSWVNAVISVANASGALTAGYFGMWLSQHIPPFVTPLLAAFAFGVLSFQEFQQSQQQQQQQSWETSSGSSVDNTTTQQQQQQQRNEASAWNVGEVVQLAIPMTLNNLAGGVAGGAAGLSPIVSSCYALVASFLTMAVGYWVGRHLGTKYLTKGKNQMVSSFSPPLLSACLLGILCILTLVEAFATISVP